MTDQESVLEVRLDRSDFRIDLRLEWQVKTLVLFGASGSAAVAKAKGGMSSASGGGMVASSVTGWTERIAK